MGTNYYVKLPGSPPCEHCGRSEPDEELHIGKSSVGWCFSLHVIPERGINDLDDWLPLFETGTIRDEYGDALTAQEMIDRITNRGHPGGRLPAGALPGPNGLARHRIGQFCVKHGSGTWDCIPGEFS